MPYAEDTCPGGKAGRPRMRFVMLLAAIGLLFAFPASSGARAAQPGPGLTLYGADARSLGDAPRLNTDVVMKVSGMLARVTVTQRFENPGNDWAEGIYVFPLPEDAAVDHLRMRYAGRLIEGEIREKQQARREYEQAKAQGKGASLLDQQRANVFTTSVANIPPGQIVEIEIEYQQTARWQARAYSLRFPMVVAPRYIPGQPLRTQNRTPGSHGWAMATDQVPDAALITPPVLDGAGDDFNPLSIAVDLDVGLNLSGIESPYHRIDVQRLAAGHYRVELADGPVPAERDFVLRWQPELDAAPAAALFSQTRQDHHYSLLMVMPPHAQAGMPRVARELILVVDTSGSMHGESIEQARSALASALRQLGPADRFNIVQFSDRFESLFGKAVPADSANLGRARAYVRGLTAEGGTEMLPALRYALHDAQPSGLLRQVVFLTDGAVGNEQALFELVADRIGDSRLFTVGIGSAPNALFMRRAAEFGRGSFSYIGSTSEVEQQMAQLFGRLSAPVLTDVNIRWESEQAESAVDQAPSRIPDLYADEPLVVAVRSRQPVRRAVIEGHLGNRRWRHEVAMGQGASSETVHALWARRKIDDWLARGITGESSDTVKQAVLDIALDHHLVSRYTSLVAVDRTPSRPDGRDLNSAAVPARLPAGWSADAVFGRLPGTATPAPLLLLGGLFSLGLAWLTRRRT